MKTQIAIILTFVSFALTGLAQVPTAPPTLTSPPPALSTPALATPPVGTPVATPTIAAGAAASPAATPDENDLESRIERKVKRGVHITFGDDEDEEKRVVRRRDRDRDDYRRWKSHDEDSALMAIPIVAIIFTTLFGAPVMIVGVIMFFSYWKQRSLHRTVRMMVEKGQPIPEGLFVAPPASPARQRSDVRRGIILCMVGIGIMLFFAAINEWEGGAWALGIIPFLIGCAYLLVWKFEAKKQPDTLNTSTDNPPPLA